MYISVYYLLNNINPFSYWVHICVHKFNIKLLYHNMGTKKKSIFFVCYINIGKCFCTNDLLFRKRILISD